MKGSKEISARLTREQFLFLEDFRSRCDGSDSLSISEASILRCLLRLFEKVDVDVKGVKTENELFYRSLKAVGTYQ